MWIEFWIIHSYKTQNITYWELFSGTFFPFFSGALIPRFVSSNTPYKVSITAVQWRYTCAYSNTCNLFPFVYFTDILGPWPNTVATFADAPHSDSYNSTVKITVVTSVCQKTGGKNANANQKYKHRKQKQKRQQSPNNNKQDIGKSVLCGLRKLFLHLRSVIFACVA